MQYHIPAIASEVVKLVREMKTAGKELIPNIPHQLLNSEML